MNDSGDRDRPARPGLHLPEQALSIGLAVLVLSLTGPFQTYAMPLPKRALYWGLCLLTGWGFVLGLILTLRRLWPGMAPVRRVALALAGAAVPTVLAVQLIEAQMRLGREGTPVWQLILNVAVIFAVIGGLVMSHLSGRQVQPGPLPERNAFLDRLPPKLGTALISLSAQDHYVEVVTAKGRELLHMRLSEAIELLGSYPGQQIHRSHWISAHAFTGLERSGDRVIAHLVDGRSLPVSRSYLAAVRKMAPVRPMPAISA